MSGLGAVPKRLAVQGLYCTDKASVELVSGLGAVRKRLAVQLQGLYCTDKASVELVSGLGHSRSCPKKAGSPRTVLYR